MLQSLFVNTLVKREPYNFKENTILWTLFGYGFLKLKLNQDAQ